MVSTVSPKAKLTPRNPMPSVGKPAASTALPQPAKISQKVPKNSAPRRQLTDQPVLELPVTACGAAPTPANAAGVSANSRGAPLVGTPTAATTSTAGHSGSPIWVRTSQVPSARRCTAYSGKSKSIKLKYRVGPAYLLRRRAARTAAPFYSFSFFFDRQVFCDPFQLIGPLFDLPIVDLGGGYLHHVS